MAGATMDGHFAAEAADATLDGAGADAEHFEFGEVIGATERKAGTVVLHFDVEEFALFGKGDGDAGGLGVFVDVVEGFAHDLEDFEEALGFAGDFLAGVAGGDTGVFLEIFDETTDGGGEAFAFDF